MRGPHLCLSGLALLLSGCGGTVQIRDRVSGTPLAQAQARIGSTTVMADERGRLASALPGDPGQRVVISHPGHQSRDVPLGVLQRLDRFDLAPDWQAGIHASAKPLPVIIPKPCDCPGQR